MPKRALVSVADKQGVVELAKKLTKAGYELISTGGTKTALEKEGIAVTSVEDVTGFPECFGGRVKTMHPLIMGGVLFRRHDPDHQEQAKKLGIAPIDLVIVNLYPFAKTAADHSKAFPDVIEQIDIGGPTLLRSAAKNHESVTVVCDPADYERIVSEIEKSGDTSVELRKELAAKVFLHTASYDAMITEYLSGGTNTGILLTKGTKLRYGENPHQWGKYYEVYDSAKVGESNESNRQAVSGERLAVDKEMEASRYSLAATRSSEEGRKDGWGRILQGKEMSYLNILDADAAWDAATEFTDPTAVFVKHANPSGIASHGDINEAFQRAYDADRLSAFGVIIALNRPCTEVIAKKIIDQKIFTEVIIAPSFEEGSLDIFKEKPNIRVIQQAVSDERLAMSTGGNSIGFPLPATPSIVYRSVLGGMLAQERDSRVMQAADLTVVTKKQPSAEQLRDLLFAWKVVKYTKSNAIVFAKDSTTVGIVAGQTSRVDSTWIAAKRAGERAKGAVMASDAFFPFPDSVEEAAKHGITAIIQPGGSMRDQEVFAKAEELGIVMVTTGVRAFRH